MEDVRLLSEVGEKRLVRDVVLRHLSLSQRNWRNDDAAVLPIGDGRAMVVTTDAGPRRPFLLHVELNDYEALGHFFATMSLSDVASMGAAPVALVAAFLMPSDLKVGVFDRLLAGVQIACEEQRCEFVGGDTKEAGELRVVTTAVGHGEVAGLLSRQSCESGDLVFVSGPIGATLASYREARRRGSPVRRPTARVEVGLALSSARIATSCMDMSDGPLDAARTLAQCSGLQIELDLGAVPFEPPPEGANPTRWRQLLSAVGGDFELMFTVPPTRAAEARLLGAVECGRVLSGQVVSPAVEVRNGQGLSLPEPWEHFRSTGSVVALVKELLL